MENNILKKSNEKKYYDMPLTLSSLLVNSNIIIGPQLKEDNPSQFFLRILKIHNISTYSCIENIKIMI